MNVNTKAKIIMDELLEIVGVSTEANHPSVSPLDQPDLDQSKSKESGLPLTVQDIINQLSEMVHKNPESAEYQISMYDYDDFVNGPTYAIFSVNGYDVIELPESGDRYVDDKLTSDKIVVFSL